METSLIKRLIDCKDRGTLVVLFQLGNTVYTTGRLVNIYLNMPSICTVD